MPYNGDFYAAYAEYLVEPRVRAVHDRMLAMAKAAGDFSRALDLGCGQGAEFYRYSDVTWYLGVDVNATPIFGGGNSASASTISGDYRHLPAMTRLAYDHKLTSVVSLFSVECTAPAAQNEAFYTEIFERMPWVNCMLVSGFFYEHARFQERIEEAGGITSYQSTGCLEPSEVYSETLMYVPCPSTLFGDDVIEVWRLLVRKPTAGK